MNETLVSRRFSHPGQNWVLESIWKMDDHKVRVLITRNAYDFQSTAEAFRWNGEEWKFVAHLTHEEMEVLGPGPLNKQGPKVVSYVSDTLDADAEVAFTNDEGALLDRVAEVLA